MCEWDKYVYVECQECGCVFRVLRVGTRVSSLFCPRCGEVQIGPEYVGKEEWMKQHGISEEG